MLNEADILYNPLKHHLPVLKKLIQEYSNDFLILSKEVLKLGNSQMDMYYGQLSLASLYQEIISSIPVNNKIEYTKWLTDSNDFREIKLSDQSTWILRLSDQPAFIHLHPARYSKLGLRVKATALKTAVMIKGFALKESKKPDLDQVNSLRKDFLDLPPLKDLERNDHLNELVRLLNFSS